MLCVTAAGCCCHGNRQTRCNVDRVESRQLQELSEQDGELTVSLRQTAAADDDDDNDVCVVCTGMALQLNVAQ